MSALVVKLSFGSDLRRVRLEEASHTILVDIVKATFPQLAAPEVRVALQYEDDEGDYVHIGSDGELGEAFRVSADLGRPCLKVIVTSATVPAPDSEKRVKLEEAPVMRDLPSVPASVPEAAPAPAVGQGVPVEKLVTLVSLLRQEAALNPMPFTSLIFTALPNPSVSSLFARVLPLLPNIDAVLSVVSTDPALRVLLSLPVVQPFLAAAGIDVEECVPGVEGATAQSPSPVTPGAPLHLLHSLIQQFGGMGVCGGAGEEEEASGAPAFDGPCGLPVHRCVTCDGCGLSPIMGDRFKCATCPNFDLCGRCHGSNTSHGHAFTHIPVPIAYTPSPIGTTVGGKPVHAGITCDGCNVSPITGARFQCTVCRDYDLCEECEAKNVHPDHAMLKIRDASQAPAKLIAILRPDQHVGEAVHGTVDAEATEGPCGRFFHLSRGGHKRHHGHGHAEGGCRGRKHERRGGRWGHRGSSWGVSASPAREGDADMEAAIAESLKMVEATAAAVEAVPAPVPTPVAAPPPRAPLTLVKQEGDEFTARFVTHITLTDAAPIIGGSCVVKTWRMKNDGERAWPVGTRLVHVGAEALGAPEEGVAVASAAPGESVDISLPLAAPAVPGRHVGYFRLVTPAGVRFGHRIWADLFVENSNTAAVLATLATPAPVPVVATPAPVAVAAPAQEEPTAPAAEPEGEEDVVTEAPPRKWQSELLQMADMGFFDLEANSTALDAMQGDVTRAVEALLAAGSR